ncbi:hypothetical protein KUV51_03845 [Tateyamaria omphalii]|uniref:hypothetical protein n=1 Tax=Tateyamaria omphalii TaxID=299262 RepID=UPI001C99B41C|nr:hypothetical protein [Tateyamaria omphalii]MBY5932120.1 hypothetical protein [Tateyamaria omphalii]
MSHPAAPSRHKFRQQQEPKDMVRILWLVGAYFLITSALMWAAPLSWYRLTPGVAAMGPFNLHFIRDIVLIFAVSGLAVLHGCRTGQRAVLLVGLAWPALHALFHILLWIERGVPLDTIALVNLAGLQLPVWTSLAIASSIEPKESHP